MEELAKFHKLVSYRFLALRIGCSLEKFASQSHLGERWYLHLDPRSYPASMSDGTGRVVFDRLLPPEMLRRGRDHPWEGQRPSFYPPSMQFSFLLRIVKDVFGQPMHAGIPGNRKTKDLPFGAVRTWADYFLYSPKSAAIFVSGVTTQDSGEEENQGPAFQRCADLGGLFSLPIQHPILLPSWGPTKQLRVRLTWATAGTGLSALCERERIIFFTNPTSNSAAILESSKTTPSRIGLSDSRDQPFNVVRTWAGYFLYPSNFQFSCHLGS